MNKLDVLKPALSGRNEEIFNYQINIDNYERALAVIENKHSDNKVLLEFAEQIKGLLESSKNEQLKSIIIRDVIAEQIAELEES